MALGIKNRYGTLIGVGQFSSAGGVDMLNISAPAANITLGRPPFTQPIQSIDASGAITFALLDAANQNLGRKFFLAETSGNPLDIQSPAGAVIITLNNSSCVVTCLNDAANTAAAWYVTSS